MSDKKPKFDRAAFKKAIAHVESSGGKNLDNPNSSAAGRYHFLYRYIKGNPALKGVSKREFINSPELQEQVMDMALDGKLKGYPNYIKKANELKASHETNLRVDEIAAITHFLGASGAKKYMSNPTEFKTPGGNNNASVKQYVARFNTGQGTQSSFDANPIRTSKSTVTNQGLMAESAMKNPINGAYPIGERNVVKNDIHSTPMNNFAQGGALTNSGCGGPGQPPCAEVNSQENEVGFIEGIKRALEKNSYDKDLIEFKGGGTHEENPLGGIPQGIGANGKLNTVEEGESKFSFDDGDYVFSERGMLDGTGFDIPSKENTLAKGGYVDPPLKNKSNAGKNEPLIRNNSIEHLNNMLNKERGYGLGNSENKVDEDISELALENGSSKYNKSKLSLESVLGRFNDKPDPKLIRKTLKQGSKGDVVSELQKKLINSGFLNDTADGIFGKKTKQAVKDYQKSRGLKVDGIAGKNTLNSINKESFKNHNEFKLQDKDNMSVGVNKFDGKNIPVKKEPISEKDPRMTRYDKEVSTITEVKNKIPIAYRQYINDTFRDDEDITMKSLGRDEYMKAVEAVEMNLKKGKMKVDYDDWRAVGATGSNVKTDGLNMQNPATSMMKFMGAGRIVKEKNGDIYLVDQYNWNDAGGKENRYKNKDMDEDGLLPLSESTGVGNSVYRLARNFKTKYGRGEGKGAKSRIFMGNIKEYNL